MSCKEVQRLIDAYEDGELDLATSLQVEEHLRECPTCSRLHRNQQAASWLLRSGALRFQASPELRERIHASLEDAVRREARAERAASRVSWRMLGAMAASLAVVAIVGWLLATKVATSSANDLVAQEVISGHVRSLMASHLTDMPSSDQHTVKPWFAGKLDFSPHVADLAGDGFPLIGGRLDYLEKRPAAALVYQHRKHIINLFVWPAKGHDTAATTLSIRGYNLVQWTQSGLIYWAVSDINSRELKDFVRLAQK